MGKCYVMFPLKYHKALDFGATIVKLEQGSAGRDVPEISGTSEDGEDVDVLRRPELEYES